MLSIASGYLPEKTRAPLAILATAVAYYFCAVFSLTMSFKPDYIAALWLPNAVLLCVLVLSRTRDWWLFLLAAIPAELAADLPSGISVTMAMGFVLSDWVEVLTGATILRIAIRDPIRFDNLGQMIRFLFICVILAPFVGAFPGAAATGMGSNGLGYLTRWGRWFMGDSLTHLIVTPFFLLWLTWVPQESSRRNRWHFLEKTMLAMAMCAIGIFTLGGDPNRSIAFPASLFAPFPLLLWTAVRFGPRGTYTASAFIAILSIWNASHGYGPFTTQSPAANVLNLQVALFFASTPLFFLAVMIEERRKAVRELTISEDKFRMLFENAGDAIFILDCDGRFREVNPAACGRLGYTREAMLRMNASEIEAPEYVIQNAQRFRNLQKQGQALFETAYQTSGGTIIPSEVSAQVVDYLGEKAVLSIARDISRRKKAEKDLLASEERFRRMAENIHEVFWMCEPNLKKFLYVNPAYERLWRRSILELHQDPENWMKAVDPRDAGVVRQNLELQAQGHATHEEFRILWPEGNIRWIENRAYPIRSPNGDVHLITGIAEDITGRKEAEEARGKLEMQLQQAQKMEAIGALAGGVAHDFNNLLMGIQGRTSLMLADKTMADPHMEHLRGIEAYVKSATALTGQLLTFARGGTCEVKATDMNALVANSSGMFGRTRKEIHIHQRLNDNLWPVDADRRQMEQVLLNLYVNAWQAMPDGGELFITTNNVTLDQKDLRMLPIEPGRYITISITDTGIGMDASTQQRIFEPFFTTKGNEGGTGLGLSSAYGIVRNHGGFIHVYSEKGKGTTFNIYLPASNSEVVAEYDEPDQIAEGTETILLVDDEEMIIEVGGEILEALGYRVLKAKGGREAVDAYRDAWREIDLVILDMVMPGLSGGYTFDLLRQINPEAKVILSSGYSINGTASEIMRRGCDGFIQKPFNMEQLSRKIREIMNAGKEASPP